MARSRSSRIAAAICGALLLAICTACLKMDQTLTVRDDGSGVLVTEILLDGDMSELFAAFGGSGELDALVEEMAADLPAELDDNLSIESIEDDGRPGVRITATFESIEELDELMAAAAEADAAASGAPLDASATAQFELRRKDDGWLFEMAGFASSIPSDGDLALPDDPLLDDLPPEAADALEGLSEGAEEAIESMQQMLEGLEMRFSVTLPGPIVESNADEVDGNTATWTFTIEDEGTDRLFAQSGPPSPFPVLPAAIGGVALLLLVIGAILLMRGRRAKPLEPIVVGAGAAPAGGAGGAPAGPVWGPAPSGPATSPTMPAGPPTAPHPPATTGFPAATQNLTPPAFAPPAAPPTAPPAFAPPQPAPATEPSLPPLPPVEPPTQEQPPTREQPPPPPPWAPPEQPR